MESNQQRVIDNINELIKICNDGAHGYNNAADAIEIDELETIFRRLSQQRKGFVEDLKNEIRTMGGEVDDTRDVEGVIHNTWVKIKAFITAKDTESIIEACKTGEEYAFKKYEEVLKDSEFPNNIKETLSEQHQLIKGAYTQLEQFEHEFTKKNNNRRNH